MEPRSHLTVVPLESGRSAITSGENKKEQEKSASGLTKLLCRLFPRKSLGSIWSMVAKKPPQLRGVPAGYSWQNWKRFHILKDYLQPNSSMTLDVALCRILNLTKGSNVIPDFTEAAFELATQIPYHSAHWKLARFFRAFSEHEEVFRRWSKDGGVYKNLKTFWNNIAMDSHDDYRLNVQSAEWDHTPARDVNFQAFLAHLIEAGVYISGPKDALFAIRVAFDQGGDATNEAHTQEVRDGYVLAAAQWVLWSGQMFFKWMVFDPAVFDLETEQWVNPVPGWEKQTTQVRGGGGGGGTTGDEDDTLETPRFQTARDRWLFWRDCFETASMGKERSEECRTVAAKVVGLMNTLVESMLFPEGWRTGRIVIMKPDGTVLENEEVADKNKADSNDGSISKMGDVNKELEIEDREDNEDGTEDQNKNVQ